MFVEVAPGVFAVHNRFVEGKCGIVIGENGALAIDACNDPDEGRAMAEFIRDRGWVPNRLVLTHGHGDHMLGAEGFRGSDVFAHVSAPEVIRRQLAGWAERTGEPIAQVQVRVVWPTIAFSEALWIDLGGKRVRFFHAPGHSEDGVCAYVEEDRVLFGGDTVVTGIVPAIGDGDSRALERTLRVLAHMEVEVLVPGHGPVLQGVAHVREWLAGWADYLSRVRSFVRDALDRGDDPQTVAAAAEYEAFIGDRLPADRHSMPRRHRSTVERIVEEEGIGRAR